MTNKTIWIRFIAVIGLILAILAGIIEQLLRTPMNYYFPGRPKFDYVWLAICVVLALYFLLVIFRGRFRLFPWRSKS